MFFALLMLVASSCKTRKALPAEPQACNIPSRTAEALSDSLRKNQLDFKTLSAKFDAEVSINGDKTSFNVNMRMSKDSMIWMSISPALGIEVARALVTKDTVMFMNRLNNTYFKGDFAYISKLLQADLDFEMLQSLMVGNNVDFYDEPEKLRVSVRDCKYLLSTVRRRKLRRVIDRNKELRDPVQTIWLEPSTFKITRLLFNEFNTNRTFDATFEKLEKVESYTFPHYMRFDIKAEKNVLITLEYDKVTLNKDVSYPFSIPEKYERLIYKEK